MLTAVILLVAEFCSPEKRHIISVFKLIQDLIALSEVKVVSRFQQLIDKLPGDHKARWFAGAALNSSLDFDERSSIDDIVSFANVFSISNRRSGDIKSILGETKSILCDKIDIEQEIQASLNAAKNQRNILMLMPLLVVPMMSSFSQGSDNQAVNITVKLVGIAVFALAYYIGRKITNINV